MMANQSQMNDKSRSIN